MIIFAAIGLWLSGFGLAWYFGRERPQHPEPPDYQFPRMTLTEWAEEHVTARKDGEA